MLMTAARPKCTYSTATSWHGHEMRAWRKVSWCMRGVMKRFISMHHCSQARRIAADSKRFVRRINPDRSPDELPQLPITHGLALWLAADVMPVSKERRSGIDVARYSHRRQPVSR